MARSDAERLDFLERLAVACGAGMGPQLNWFPEERGNVMEGEPDYHLPGGFHIGDDDSEPYHATLNAAIDYAMDKEASRAPQA